MKIPARFLDIKHAFDHPATLGIVAAIILALLTASMLLRAFKHSQKIGSKAYSELLARIRSWYVLVAMIVLPILLGPAWVCGFLLLLSLFCFREYAQATGLINSQSAMISVIIAILITYFAVLDHWMGLFTTSWAFGICLITVVSILPDHPAGYVRRVALATVGFSLFGVSIGHLAFLSNDTHFRPILLWILVCTELNDVFAYLVGKTLGKHKLLPNTSPNKTVGGAIGALLLTCLLATFLGHYVFQETTIDHWPHLLTLGLLISILGQCGDLVISSIKRDLGIKDMAETIPGHGGLLDRFDSLLLVAPIVFHYLNYFLDNGIGHGQPVRILTSG